MSASLLSCSSSSSFLPETSRSRYRNNHSRTMATCIDNSRTKTATKNRRSCDKDQARIDNSLYKYVEFSRPSFCDLFSCAPIDPNCEKTMDQSSSPVSFDVVDEDEEDLWSKICEEAQFDVKQEPILANYYCSLILCHNSLESALTNQLANKLSNQFLPSCVFSEVFWSVLSEDIEIRRAIREDLKAVKERDPACISFVHCLLNFKGFLACQAHRVSHKLWSQGRKVMALLIQNRVSEVFAVDIHPGAKIGRGILLDHATGVVIGETAVVGNNVSILHNVTLGGTGKVSGDRHPKIGDGVLVGAGSNVLGNVRVGEGAKIGAGSVVLKEVPPRTTAVGNPARLLGGKENPVRLDKIPSLTMDHTSFISEWSDYVI